MTTLTTTLMWKRWQWRRRHWCWQRWRSDDDAQTMTLRRWRWDNDTETMTPTWWRWHNDADMTLTRWCWHNDADAMTLTWWCWHDDADLMTPTRWRWHNDANKNADDDAADNKNAHQDASLVYWPCFRNTGMTKEFVTLCQETELDIPWRPRTFKPARSVQIAISFVATFVVHSAKKVTVITHVLNIWVKFD